MKCYALTKAISFFMVSVVLLCCTFKNAPAQTQSATTGFSEKEILQAVNEVRAKGCNCGSRYMPPVKPLRWNAQLEQAAQTQTNYMNKTGRMSHTGANGSQPGNRISATGYRWSYYAENVAAGQKNVREVMASWLASPGHCNNIMNANAVEIAVAKTGKYWAMVFARPR